MAFTKVDSAYAAGLLDGEGCILIWRLNAGRGVSPEYAMRVTIANTVKDMTTWLKERFGGNVSFSPYVRSGKTRLMYYWNLSARQATRFLLTVQPYSVIKKKQIYLALEFAKTVNGHRGKGCSLPQSIKVRRDKLRVMLQQAKRSV